MSKLSSGGGLLPYFKSKKDSMGRDREFPAQTMSGDETIATQLLIALAPRGVRPKRSSPLAGDRSAKRSNSEWLRHCHRHLVHIIVGFGEMREYVEPILPKIVSGFESLLLLGLPQESLYFCWTMHPKTHGTHAHGALTRMLLINGMPYDPNLDPELVLHFDRLICLKGGFMDPLDPAGGRLLYAGLGSAKTANEHEIREICETSTQRYHAHPRQLSSHDEFLLLLKDDLKYIILASPGPGGESRLVEPSPVPGLRVPQYRNAVVVASRDEKRAICFFGPLAHPKFQCTVFDERIGERTFATELLKCDSAHQSQYFAEFLGLAEQRMLRQNQLGRVRLEDCVTLDDLKFLDPNGPPLEGWSLDLPRMDALEALEAMDPLERWSDRNWPFADIGWPVPDIDPLDYLQYDLDLEEFGEDLDVPDTILSQKNIVTPPTVTPRPAPAGFRSIFPKPGYLIRAFKPARDRVEEPSPVLPPKQAPKSVEPHTVPALDWERERRQRRNLALETSLEAALLFEASLLPRPPEIS